MKKYVYESPDGGKTIYRRNFGEYDLRTIIKNEPNDKVSDTKILVDLHEKIKPKKIPILLEGMFAYIVYDEKKKEILI